METVVVQQDKEYRIAVAAQNEDEEELHQVSHIYELSPYTMLLASLGLCTGVVLHSYAQHHNVKLELAQITLTYHREERQGSGQPFVEWIEESLQMEGDLSDEQYERLGRVGHQCSIRKMLESGIEVRSELIPQARHTHSMSSGT